MTAQPGIAPAAQPTAGTMFAALYGNFVPHNWHDPEHDAYSLFYHRSLAMGWLADGEAPGLWAMNDAGWDHPLAANAELASWFQVEASAVPSDRPLPVQPFLRCAHDATSRAGTLDLSAVQVLLPLRGLAATTRPAYAAVPSMRTIPWFTSRDPRSATPVDVRADSGQDSSILAVTDELANRLGHLDQDVFVGTSHHTTSRSDVLLPPFDDSFWNGPPLNGVVLRGQLAEWSCDAIGWLAEVVAESVAQLGVRSPLLFTVTRT